MHIVDLNPDRTPINGVFSQMKKLLIASVAAIMMPLAVCLYYLSVYFGWPFWWYVLAFFVQLSSGVAVVISIPVPGHKVTWGLSALVLPFLSMSVLGVVALVTMHRNTQPKSMESE